MTDEEIDQSYGTAATDRGAKSQREALAEWMEGIASHNTNPPGESIPYLGRALVKLSKKNVFQIPERIAVYDSAHAAILSIPGHAQYFADEIERERKTVEHLLPNVGPRCSYDRHRMWHFETLAHLPSPETVKVLGDYLSDERDLYELTPEQTKGQSCITGGSTGNSTHSAKALEMSALRNKPYREGTVYDIDMAKATWRAWWEQVKSGNKTFSFVGQKEEYRFKLDGTWETLAMANPPDDAPQSTRAVSPSSRTAHGKTWMWIIGAMLLALSVVFWLGVRNSTNRD